MLDPVELKLFPSCFDCISWSPDGELAVALGEYVHVLIPRIKAPTSNRTTETPSGSNTQWTTTKFRANVFTNTEWPMIFPQPGNTFSLGEEQSSSHVVALAWSHHRLARYSRHVLAVLTSNLVLSLWELVDGYSKWMRTVVVNNALREAFGLSLRGKGSILYRKMHVRCFCWSPKSDEDDHHEDALHGHQAYRDMSLLAVANDMNDITLIRVRNDRLRPDMNTRRQLWVEVISQNEIPAPHVAYPRMQPDSLLGQSVRSVPIISHITWGPARQSFDDQGNPRYSSPLAIIHATGVKAFLLHARFEDPGRAAEDSDTDAKLDLRLGEAIPISQEPQFESMSFHGPLRWIDHAGPKNPSSSCLVVGYLGGYALISFDHLFTHKSAGTEQSTSTVSLYHALHADTVEDDRLLEWEPITAITSTEDTKSHTTVIHVTHFSSSLRSLPLQAIQVRDITACNNGRSDNAQTADLHRQMEGFRSRFDLDHDLGGMSLARIWGMTSHRGWIAACFTVHPSDMVEYVTTARQRSRIVFTPPHPKEGESAELPWRIPPELTPQRMKAGRDKALSFILRDSHRDLLHDHWVKKLQYAAICCLITDQDPVDAPHLLEAAKSAAKWLSSTFSLDLSVELSCINEKLKSQIELPAGSAGGPETSKHLPGKTCDAQTGPGDDVFEYCDICGSGIDWYSAEESQCAEGHVFARCGLTFLSIQDPSISKRCSVCGSEVLDAELVDFPSVIGPGMGAAGGSQPQRPHERLIDILCDAFDTCIYCGGRFRD
ncbi:zinc-finger of transcription factor IIIC complex domain-containing protein [Histoplasma capsulatum G186AR]|uniref:Zinc-finger of transcription factor IIIC complex domain-containing protein n=1 Tax=Ajellomyces capsulatus TaxID=5037 RepID=A0A8H7YSP9_AJECA|nr:zinc-finger of transcription factor IIIC complex domain-containing protein [Histoplasma capsulatum]QSS73448.1 zinc-finger of transcription factor IIIC complex domain-containing protein [Histoplasma capsulatum G186AR]